jgi:hypothetical protein
MADATPIRVGQVNGAGATDALFLKVYGGEVLSAFETEAKTLDKHTIRTIKSGKSAQFPATWKVTAAYHTPGAEINGSTSNVNEIVISIDQQLIAAVAIPKIDEAMNHFDYRSEYSKQAGLALAKAWDTNVLTCATLAARAPATVTGGPAGTALTSTTTLYKTSATDLAAGIYAAVLAMDQNDVPSSEEKYVFMRPAQYSLLAQKTDLYNNLFAGGNGNYADGQVLRIGGAVLVKTNNLPITNVVTGLAKYQGDFSKTAAVIMTKQAVGTVKLLDLAQEMEWDMRRQVTLLLAKYAMGVGVLRPECAVELKTTT